MLRATIGLNSSANSLASVNTESRVTPEMEEDERWIQMRDDGYVGGGNEGRKIIMFFARAAADFFSTTHPARLSRA